MAIQFQHEYHLLELEPSADWKNARASYRRLVHIWHPDRYSQRPRERVHAQTKFIELTKAFNSLRTYYRENNRMPFEQIKQALSDSAVPPAHQQIKPEDAAITETSILNKRKPSNGLLKPNQLRSLLWAIPAAATVLMGIAVFVVIDRSAKQNSIDAARRVLRTVEPSAYMANSEEITKANNRNNVVNSVQGQPKMGDQLAKDLFK